MAEAAPPGEHRPPKSPPSFGTSAGHDPRVLRSQTRSPRRARGACHVRVFAAARVSIFSSRSCWPNVLALRPLCSESASAVSHRQQHARSSNSLPDHARLSDWATRSARAACRVMSAAIARTRHRSFAFPDGVRRVILPASRVAYGVLHNSPMKVRLGRLSVTLTLGDIVNWVRRDLSDFKDVVDDFTAVCFADGPGVDHQGRGKVCSYVCEVKADGDWFSREVKVRDIQTRAYSWESWDRGSAICHGQFTESRDQLGLRVPGFAKFKVDQAGTVTNPQGLISKVYRGEAPYFYGPYTREAPELVEPLRKGAR